MDFGTAFGCQALFGFRNECGILGAFFVCDIREGVNVEHTTSVEFWGRAVLIKRCVFMDECTGDIIQSLRAEYA